MKKEKRKTIGLALGSGGFRGFACVGVIKTLNKYNIPIDYIAGSSIGSFIGAHYSLYKDTAALEKYILKHQSEIVLEMIGLNWKNIIKRKSSKKNMEDILKQCFNNASFKDLNIPFQATGTDLSNGKLVLFKKGKLAKAIRSSISIPVVLSATNRGGTKVVDGALINPVPDDVVKDMGADIVIAVNLYKYSADVKNITRQKSFYYSLIIMLSNLAKYSMKHADIIIEPDASSFTKGTLLHRYISNDIGKKLISIGEKETEKIIPQLKKLMKKK